MAGGLKCSSRDLTLEFAGNRTGLRQTEGGVISVCVSVCVLSYVLVFGLFVSLYLYASERVYVHTQITHVSSVHSGACMFVCLCTCN